MSGAVLSAEEEPPTQDPVEVARIAAALHVVDRCIPGEDGSHSCPDRAAKVVASLRSTSRDSEVREAAREVVRMEAAGRIQDANGAIEDLAAILDRSSEAAPTPLPEGACGVMGLCEEPKGHAGPHETSVDRALASEAAPVVRVSEAALRSIFAERGWAIDMDDREGQPLNAFAELAARLTQSPEPGAR